MYAYVIEGCSYVVNSRKHTKYSSKNWLNIGPVFARPAGPTPTPLMETIAFYDIH